MDWWHSVLLQVLFLVIGFAWGYMQARDTYYEKGYHDALDAMKSNKEDFDYIAGGG